MTLFRLLGFLTLAALLLAMVTACPGARVAAFIDYPSAILVFGGTVAVLMIACDLRDWRNAARVLIGPRKRLDPVTCRAAAHFFAVASRAAIALGVVGQVVGMIIMLGQLDDPDALGPGLAVSLISVLYGVMLSEFFFVPMQSTAQRRADSAEEPSAGRFIPLLLLLFVAFTIGSLFMLIVAIL